jgi:hypothetical protein
VITTEEAHYGVLECDAGMLKQSNSLDFSVGFSLYFYVKIISAIFLVGLFCVTAQAEDWTVNGKVYPNVKVVKVEDDLVSITYDGGIGRLALSDLTQELQKRFNYDPTKAKQASDERASQAAAADAEEAPKIQLMMEEKAQQDAIDAQNERAALNQQARSHNLASRPYTPTYSSAPTPEQLANQQKYQEMQDKARAIEAEDEANGCAHAAGQVTQVLPEGFIGQVNTRWGMYSPCFVKCDSKDMVDGQTWTGIIIPQHTYHYTTTDGAAATIPAFSTNLKETRSAPVASNYVPSRDEQQSTTFFFFW